jgi:TRAF3-interacting protein 1
MKKPKDMDNLKFLKELVQKLCKNTTPLGKSLDFIRDDIENMNREKEKWRQQFIKST